MPKQLKIIIFTLLYFSMAFSVSCYAAKTHLITNKIQSAKTAMQVLASLEAGNARYVNRKPRFYNQRLLGKMASKKGQAPYAFVLSCSDSRSVPETVFNEPTGALFVSRVAGNVMGTDVMGSLEYTTQYLGTKLVVIMGHTQCGAAVGACEHVDKPRNLNSLLKKFQPAIKQVDMHKHSLDCGNAHVIDKIARQNVIDQIKYLYKHSPATMKLVRKRRIMVVGAMHNISTGKVRFFNIHGKNIVLP